MSESEQLEELKQEWNFERIAADLRQPNLGRESSIPLNQELAPEDEWSLHDIEESKSNN